MIVRCGGQRDFRDGHRAADDITIANASQKYLLTAPELSSSAAFLSGAELKVGAGDALPAMKGVRMPPGDVALSFPDANNSSCRAR